MSTHPYAAPSDLPPDGFVERWTAARKEAVVVRVVSGEVTAGDAMRRWRISVEELDCWLAGYRKRGRDGLRATAVPTQGRLL